MWITYNGEIFNHADVRPELEAAGHRYKSHCDTETVIHAYEQYGDQCVTRYPRHVCLRHLGRTQAQLFCARDRLGIKPFYYFWNGRLFAFASEIKALLQHPEISAEFNERLLPEYLAFGYTSGEETLFKGIRKLMPGHTMTLTCGTFTTTRNQAVLGCSLPDEIRRAAGPRMDCRVPLAARRRRSHAADVRRAPGHVPQRRSRLQRHCSNHQTSG